MRSPDYDEVDDLPLRGVSPLESLRRRLLERPSERPSPEVIERLGPFDVQTAFQFEMFLDLIEKRQARRRAN